MRTDDNNTRHDNSTVVHHLRTAINLLDDCTHVDDLRLAVKHLRTALDIVKQSDNH